MPRSYGTTNAAPYAVAPAVGAAGDTYFNTASKSLWVSDGTSWVRLAATSGKTLINSGQSTTGDVSVSTTGIRDALTVSLGVAPSAATVVANIGMHFGFGSGYMNFTGDFVRLDTAAVVATGQGLYQAIASAWAAFPLAGTWNVASGADMSFKLRANPVQFGSTSGWYNLRAVYEVYA